MIFLYSSFLNFLSFLYFFILGMLENFRVAEDMPIESDIVVTALDKVRMSFIDSLIYSILSIFYLLPAILLFPTVLLNLILINTPTVLHYLILSSRCKFK